VSKRQSYRVALPTHIGPLLLLGGSCLLAVESATPISAQTPADIAQQRLDYLVGTWDSTTEFLDDQGRVVRTDRSVNLVEPFIGTQVLLTTVVGAESVRKTIRFFDRADERYYEIGVGEAGDVWILSGGTDEYVTTSQERPAPGGRTVMVRFTHTNIRPNSFEAYMEVSRDGGETWTRANTRETLVRRTHEPGEY
jgi:hypothetical protein